MVVPIIGHAALRKLGKVPVETRVKGTIALCFADPSRLSEAAVRRGGRRGPGARRVPWSDSAMLRSTRGLVRSQFLKNRAGWAPMRTITAPTLVMWGDEDRLVAADLAPFVAAAIPDARLLVLDDIGHTAMMEDPELTARAMLGLLEDARAPVQADEPDDGRACTIGSRLWQPVGVAANGRRLVATRPGRSPGHVPRTAAARRRAHARRGVASFGGGGGPAFGDLVREFVRRYGWRAYALPVLLVGHRRRVAHSPQRARRSRTRRDRQRPHHEYDRPPQSGAPVAPNTIPLKSDTSSGKVYNSALKNGQLPRGGPYTKAGNGTFHVLRGHTKIVGTTGPLYRYDIEVENGIKGIDLTRVREAWSTPRSPTRAAGPATACALQRVVSGAIDFHITLTSAMTVRQFCGYDIPVETSCYAAPSRPRRCR